MAAPAKSTPRDAQVMAAILKDMGVLDYEPRLINQMLEFTYRYVTDVLDDAKVYSSHANKKNLDCDDIKLAIQCRMDHSFTTPPPRDLLMDIARYRNAQQLPLIKPYSQPRLPPDRYCLSAPNYKLKTMRKPRTQMSLPNTLNTGGPRFSISSLGVKGAGGSGSGQTLTVVTKAATQPTVTIISKPASTTTVKPTFRINAGSLSSNYAKIIPQSSNNNSSSNAANTIAHTSTNISNITNITNISSANSTSLGFTNISNLATSGVTNFNTSNMSNLTTTSSSSLPSMGMSSATPLSTAPISMMMSSSFSNMTTMSSNSNPLKRKAEDEDYDK